MNIYEVDFTFFIESGNENSVATKDKLLDMLNSIKMVEVYDVYDDDEDWCIDCIAEVKAESADKVDTAMNKLLEGIDIIWDYHYIKGIDNDEYWES